MFRIFRLAFCASVPIVFAACGGGGDGAAVNNDVLKDKQETYSVGGVVTGLGNSSITLSNTEDARNTVSTLQVVGDGSSSVPFTFNDKVATQAGYVVRVISAPSNLGCSVVNDRGRVATAAVTNIQVNCELNAYTVSGSVTGLAGSGLQLRNNGSDPIDVAPVSGGASVPFAFPTALSGSTPYAISVARQPTNPSQTCVVTSGGSGAGTGNHISNVVVVCTTNSFTVGGSISGLQGSGLQLQLNGGNTLAISAGSTSFQFSSTPLLSGSSYSVTVVGPTTNPVQNCTVSPGTGSGTIGNANIDSVAINCATNTYTVGGSVSGLGSNNPGLRLALSRNGAPFSTRDISGDGGFSFPQSLTDGNTYVVSIANAHSHYQCNLNNASGTINGASVGTVTVSCATSIQVVVSGLNSASSPGLMLSNSYGATSSNTSRITENRSIPGDGAFVFSTPLPAGRVYTVTVSTEHPDYSCVIADGDSIVGPAPVSVSVSCTQRTYTVGGHISGLAPTSTGLVLRRSSAGRADEDITISPSSSLVTYAFATPLPNGATFTVTEVTEPDDRVCTFSIGANSASGTINRANVSNMDVTCAAPAPLTIAGLTPAEGDLNVALGAQPQVVFSAAIDTDSVSSGALTLTSSHGTHPANVIVSGTTVTAQPMGKLMPSTTYTLTVGANIRGTNKERLAAGIHRAFTTNSGWTAPEIVGAGTGYPDPIVGVLTGATPRLGFGSNGNAIAVWESVLRYEESCSGSEVGPICFLIPVLELRSRTYSAVTHTWGSMITLSSNHSVSGYAGVALGIDAAGNAIVIWSEGSGLRERRYSAASATWSTSQGISMEGRNIETWQLAMNNDGSAWLVTGESLAGNSSIYSRKFTPGAGEWSMGSWSASAPLETDSAAAYSPFVTTSNGVSVALWYQGPFPSGLYASRNISNTMAGWSSPFLIAAGENDQYIAGGHAATDSSGNTIVTWARGPFTLSHIYARKFMNGIGWEASSTPLTTIPALYGSPQVVTNANGSAAISWAQADGVNFPAVASLGVHVARHVGGTWIDVRSFNGPYADPQSFMDASGNLSILVTQDDGYLSAIRYTASTQIWLGPQQIESIAGQAFRPIVAVNGMGSAMAVWNKNQTLYGSRFVW